MKPSANQALYNLNWTVWGEKMRESIYQLKEEIEWGKKQLMEAYDQGQPLHSQLMIHQSQELDKLIISYLQLKLDHKYVEPTDREE